MTVLVMGATGNVGGAIVQALRDREVAVTAVSRHERQWPSGVQSSNRRCSPQWNSYSDDPRAVSRTGSSVTAMSYETFSPSPPGHSRASRYATRSLVQFDHGKPTVDSLELH